VDRKLRCFVQSHRTERRQAGFAGRFEVDLHLGVDALRDRGGAAGDQGEAGHQQGVGADRYQQGKPGGVPRAAGEHPASPFLKPGAGDADRENIERWRASET
jgi:hypothetical protein